MTTPFAPTRRAVGLGALAAFAAGTAGTARAQPPLDLDAVIGSALDRFDVPGAGVALVENGRVSMARGFGVRGLGDARPVDAHTIFPIASNTKAFTAAVLATLVDEGKLSWDDPVSERLPGFEMWDPWVTRELTVRDLLVHRSGLGLGEGDLMMFPKTDFTPKELVAHLRQLKPRTSFRSTYAYDNVLYIAAGELAAAAGGRPWKELVRERIFAPAGMTDAVVGESAFYAAPDHAWPHAKLGGADRGAGRLTRLDSIQLGDVFVSAGAISASADDLSRWLTVQIGGGATPGGARVFSAAQGAQMWTPQTLIPNGADRPGPWPRPSFLAYGLGWEITDYRGEPMIRHGGFVFGFKSQTVILPGRRSGFVVLTNAEETYAIYAICLALLDRLTGVAPSDHVAAMLTARDAEARQAHAATPEMARLPAHRPSLPLSAYAGVYRDAWYGTMTIAETPQGLSIRFDRTPGMVGPLEPWRYETFRTRWPAGIEDAYVTFALSPEGKVARATLKPVSPLADFSFDYQDLDFTPVTPPAAPAAHVG